MKSDPGLRFSKYHGLGNDYLVIPAPLAALPLAEIQRICHRNFGIGSDGILVPVTPPSGAPWPGAVFAVRIFNPDGSEAEKSGNGLRIFARWLFDQRQVAEEPFAIWVPGGWVRARVAPGGSPITVDMGRASFDSASIPVNGPPRQVIDEPLIVGAETLRICAVNLGNPHCVVLNAPVDEATARRLGQLIETHPAFPNRTNVQFLHVIDRANIEIQIWERGAGYTLASGSSSCAAAISAHRMGWVDTEITVHCPGGQLQVSLHPDNNITLTGPVVHIADGVLV